MGSPQREKGFAALDCVFSDRFPESRADPEGNLSPSTSAGGDLCSFLELGHESTPLT